MKIDPRAESSQNVTPVTPETTFPPPRPAERKPGDDVKLSDELRLADQVVRAAAISGDVRPHAVERARQLMLTGRLASDVESLADRIIDSLIQARADRP